MRGTRGTRGCEGTRSLFGKSSAKTFLKDFCLRKGGSVNKVLSVYNKTAYFNEKIRRTASPPTVFMVFELPCAGMKIDCRRGLEKMFALNQKPSSERKGDHEVVEGACVTIKIVLSSPLRTLPQSLRDSSLSEGAFEKLAAIMFVLSDLQKANIPKRSRL